MKYTKYTLSEGTTITAQEIEAPEYDGYLTVLTSEMMRKGLDALAGRTAGLAEQSGRAGSYARDIRGIVRVLWRGAISRSQAFGIFYDTVRIGLTRAFHAGAAECGIKPADLTPEEQEVLNNIITSERSHISAFLIDVEAGSKVSGGKFGAFRSRLETWGLRWEDVATRAKLMACANLKLRWTINAVRVVKKNCSSCLKLNGKVKRASFWARVGVQPQNPRNDKLVCEGWL